VRNPTHREASLLVAVAVLIAVLVLWLNGCGPVGRSGDGTGSGLASGPSSFTISGDVSRPITPGKLVLLDLTLDNTNDLDLAIDQITVAVVGISAPNADADHPCTKADFEVRNLAVGGVVTLARNQTARLSELELPAKNWPAVGMINSPVNQDGCKGASLTLGYEAIGMEVTR
jgi:hypothetical protein